MVADRDCYESDSDYFKAVRRSERLEVAAGILAHSVTAHGWACEEDECRRRAVWSLDMADALIAEVDKA